MSREIGMKRFSVAVACFAIAALALALNANWTAGAAEKSIWPAWRGSDNSGVSTEAGLPVEWSATQNVLWKTAIPGRGHSSPIIWDKKVFVTTAIEGEVIPGAKAPEHKMQGQPWAHPDSRGGDRRHTLKVMALDRDSGKILWERTVHDGPVADNMHKANTYATPTPVTDGKSVYAYFGSEGLYAFDLNGKPLWKLSLGNLLTMGIGQSTSPILYKDFVIIQFDGDASETQSFIAAIDKNKGTEVWRTPRKDELGWASPIVVRAGDRDELITAGTEKIIAYDPMTGKELWSTVGLKNNAVATPSAGHGMVYISSGYPGKRMYAIRTGGSGDVTASHVAWKYERGTAYVPSPILYGDYFYTITDKGILTCLDAKTGEVKYANGRPPVPSTFTASLLAYDGKVLMFSEDGDTFVVKAGPQYEAVRTNSLGEPIFSTPAVADGKLFIRGSKHLYAISAKK